MFFNQRDSICVPYHPFPEKQVQSNIYTMSSQSRLLALCARIQESVTKVAEAIEKNDITEPSYDTTCPPVLDLPSEADNARHSALESLDELRDHLLGPVGALLDDFIGVSLPSLITS